MLVWKVGKAENKIAAKEIINSMLSNLKIFVWKSL